MRVLVTGASGMLGRATATALLARGDEVTVLQRRPSGLPCAEVLGDVADPAVVRRAARGQDAVLHLAAKVDVTGPWAEYDVSELATPQAFVQYLGEEVMIAIPLARVIERNDEQIATLESLQRPAAIFLSGDGIA